MGIPGNATDRWSQRALRNLPRNLAAIRNWRLYRNFDRYKRAVLDLNRILDLSPAPTGVRLSLANYQHPNLSPVRSGDLLRAAETPEENPFYPYFSKKLVNFLEIKQPSVVGFSLNFLSQALCTFAMLGFLRKNFPELTLVAGGGLITSWMRRRDWVDPFAGLIDHLIGGPGEVPLLSLTGRCANTRLRPQPNYAAFPLPEYFSPWRIFPYSASSGCYWNKCRFCPERAERNPYAPIPVEEVTQDLRTLTASGEPALIHLLDNAVSPSLMEGLCKRPPGAPWYGFARITRHLTDPAFCRALRRSGCVVMKLGLESGDQEVLDREQKGVRLETASNALKSLKAAGIATYVYLLFGTPSETLDSARKTLDFTVLHGPQIDFLNLAIFNLPTYGPDSMELELATDLFYEGDLSLYTGFVHPKGWHRGLVRQFLDKEFKRHPVISSILRRDPPLFTSNHAPFFCMGH